MKILTKYLFKTILYYVSLASLFLLGLQIFIELSKEFPSMGMGNYHLPQTLLYVTLILPFDIYQFFPMVSLLGFIIALGLLASNGELIVMRTAGMSLFNLFQRIAAVGALLILFMLLIGEIISPPALHRAEKIKLEALNEGKMLLTKQGRWLHGDDEIINIKTITGKNLENITRYKIGNQAKLHAIIHTPHGHYDGNHWILRESQGTTFEKHKTLSSYTSREISKIKFSPQLLSIDALDSDQKNIVALHTYAKQRIASGLDASKYVFSFWQRIFAPLAALVMILLAVPFIFGSLRTATMGFRMLIGIATGFTFYMLNQFVGPMAMVYHLPPLLAAALPTLLSTILGIVLLIKIP